MNHNLVIKSTTLIKRLNRIHSIFEMVEQRCLAADGPVTDFREEITLEELKEVYRLSDVSKFKMVESADNKKWYPNT